MPTITASADKKWDMFIHRCLIFGESERELAREGEKGEANGKMCAHLFFANRLRVALEIRV